MRAFGAVVLILCVSCSSGGGAPPPGGPPGGQAILAAPLLVAAGMETLDPLAVDLVSPTVDLDRLGLDGVAAVYEVTTPANEPFTFDLLSRSEGNVGSVRISVAHAQDDGQTPFGGVETLVEAGVVPTGTGVTVRGSWLDATGDGFTRFTCSGEIERDQVIAVESEDDGEKGAVLVCIRVGPRSAINPEPPVVGDYPGILERRSLYSSESWRFGLPTCAVSGDRTSIVVYEGDRANPFAFERFELRMQYDHVTREITGGGSVEPSPDLGNWRDHEIAALFNVLALVHSGTDAVELKISFDRGATFGQEEAFAAAAFQGAVRLAQIAMAADYSLAIVFWRTNADFSSDLMLIEGRPSAFDGGGSPTRFAFDAPRVLYHDRGDVSPFIMGATWSDGGDLVIGYGFSRFEFLPDGRWSSETQYRCAVRLFGEPGFRDTVLEQEKFVGRDPGVAVVGSGPGMQILYVYEAADGIRLRHSEDAGSTWSAPIVIGTPGAHLPMVFARPQDGATRVDVLYLTYSGEGTELHLSHWDDFLNSPREEHRLVKATREDTGTLPPDRPVPGGLPGVLPPDEGFRIKQVAWFGYDATLDGDDIVVVYDQETYDTAVIFLGPPEIFFDRGLPVPAAADQAVFVPAERPPLAPGLTEPLPEPNEDHLHVLCFLRLD